MLGFGRERPVKAAAGSVEDAADEVAGLIRGWRKQGFVRFKVRIPKGPFLARVTELLGLEIEELTLTVEAEMPPRTGG